MTTVFVLFNENVFFDNGFLSATVTDKSVLCETDFDKSSKNGTAQTDNIISKCSRSNQLSHIITPETVRPHQNCKHGKCQISFGIKENLIS